MAAAHRRIPGALTLVLGLILGWSMDHLPNTARAQARRAVSGESLATAVVDQEARIGELERRLAGGESTVASGQISVEYNHGKRVQTTQDGLYYLDWNRAWLRATVPTIRQSVGPTKVIDKFAVRDLIADFKIDTTRVSPRFKMTTGALGTYSDGCAPLFVFETVTNQVAVYKLSQHTFGTETTPKFELLEVSSIDAKTNLVPAR